MILEEAKISVPFGLTDKMLAKVIVEIRNSEIWNLSEAVSLGGSRTHFTIGYGPKIDKNGEIKSDFDAIVFPAAAVIDTRFNEDAHFDWQMTLMKSHVDLQDKFEEGGLDFDLFKGNYSIEPPRTLTELLNLKRISSAQQQELAWQRVENAKSHTELLNTFREFVNNPNYPDVSDRFLRKNLFFGQLQDIAGSYTPLPTYENIFLIRDTGDEAQKLKVELEKLGYKHVLIFP